MGTSFHRIWFGPRAIPEVYEAYWQAWQRQFPQAEFITWRDGDIDRLELTRDRLNSLQNPVSRADLARYEILYRFGGIYLDCDIMPHNHFEPEEMTKQLTVCNEDASTRYCSIGFIGAPAQHPIFRDIIAHLLSNPVDETRPNHSTGPWLFGAFLKHHEHRRLPTASFYPYLYDQPLSSIRRVNLDQTLGIHVWGGSWLSPEIQQRKAMGLLDKGDLAEPAAMLVGREDEWSEDVKVLIGTIHDLRATSAQAAMVLHQNMSIAANDRTVFEFAKVTQWMLDRDPDLTVWQIGAADGVLVDPLRSLMINYDPRAVLLEPNPYMYAMLADNYANNRNARLLQQAYALDDQPLVLNAVNPEKAQALGLPRWVLGISSMHMDKNALGGKTIDHATTQRIQSCVERIKVSTISYSELLAASQGRTPDILVVDAEGMDQAILSDIFAHGARPAVIHFEIQCLEAHEQAAVETLLDGDYVTLQFGNDMTAYRQDVLFEYANAIYVEHGIPTILAPGLAKLHGLKAA